MREIAKHDIDEMLKNIDKAIEREKAISEGKYEEITLHDIFNRNDEQNVNNQETQIQKNTDEKELSPSEDSSEDIFNIISQSVNTDDE